MLPRRLISCLFVALACACASAGDATRTLLPIRNAQQFAEWQKHPPASSPLDALSPGARERFLDSLAFGRNGLGGFDPHDLALELDAAQIRDVLALFGDEIAAYAPQIAPADARSHAVAIQRRAGISAVEAAFNRLYLRRNASMRTGEGGDLAHAGAVAAAYRGNFPASDAQRLHALSDSDLQLWLRASLDASDMSGARDIGESTLQAWNEYARRGLAADDDVGRLFNLLLATRQFDAAAGFAERHPDARLPAMPEMHVDQEAAAPRVWEFNADGSEMHSRGIDLRPTQIIVTAGCHFSADAAGDIAVDAVLGPVFREHAHWLSQPPGREPLDALRDWNRKFPDAPMLPILDRAEWAMIPDWRMPTFLVVREGRIIDSASGWDGNDPVYREQLVALLERNGLLATGAR